ncbi:hypothetical protein K490DRAFT_35531 [Saccharata proteae CBS 121410]|uniref:Integral membrane protein n=1 Tax=Saccharata proteae CBS 121410 TaxID=1314787 RepID=A0A9P4LYQ3_9PEZI|nr:hypothetical protein K490DRAFT_35531 [Saccharata proteae CBS 121410]
MDSKHAGGFLVPEHFKYEAVSTGDLTVACIVFGFTLGFALFTFSKMFRQSYRIWRRSQRITGYVSMIWLEWAACVAISVLGWLYIDEVVGPSFQYFFFLLLLWTMQTQFLLQIIINRIAILMIDQRKASRMKWIVAGVFGLINVSVFCIWIPAHLQISQTWIHINDIWDRLEKGLFLVIDAGLNFYFVYRVNSRLVSKGLTKYMPLFKYNAAIVVVSIAMDVMIIGMMSLPNSIIYAQFQALGYIVKLNIELNMADLISKVVRNHDGKHGEGTQGRSKSDNRHGGTGSGYPNTRTTAHRSAFAHLTNYIFSDHASGGSELADMQRAVSLSDGTRGPGIKKTTVVTQSQVKEEDESWSEDSSTKQLHY